MPNEKESESLLARLDERTQSIQQSIMGLRSEISDHSKAMNEKLNSLKIDIEKKVSDLEEHVEENYVTQSQFDPIRLFVYGLIGLVLTSVGIAILAIVITRPAG